MNPNGFTDDKTCIYSKRQFYSHLTQTWAETPHGPRADRRKDAHNMWGDAHYTLVNEKKAEANKLGRFVVFVGSFLTVHIIDSRSSPQKKSASIWAYNFSLCFWGGPTPDIFLISGFWTPGNPYFWIWIYPNTSTNLTANMLERTGAEKSGQAFFVIFGKVGKGDTNLSFGGSKTIGSNDRFE